MLTNSEHNAAESKVKRRACDECRQRKLACSKDPDGCERCKRESISCYYSEQKPMGRPRKRRFIDEPAHPADGSQDPGLLPFFVDDFEFDATLAEPYYPPSQQTALLPEGITDLRTASVDAGQTIWHFGNIDILAGPPINFGDADFGTGQGVIPPVEQAPQLSTASNISITDSENSPTRNTKALPPCSCLASMYLALASLQQFPTDIVAALATVRGAAATASNSLWCPHCGSVVQDNAPPPIETFQNTMLLGTILPIIANGYGQLLKMIDAETDEAVATGQTKTFRFFDYGGLCGRRESALPAIGCKEEEIFSRAVEMPPAQWRTNVRALLRVDIYGHEQPGFEHKGLKDLVKEMEYRQRIRHDIMDAQIADGTLDPTRIGHGLFTDGSTKCVGDRSRGCLEILKMAKIAIDGLVIA